MKFTIYSELSSLSSQSERTFLNHRCGQIKWATPDSGIVMKGDKCKLINLTKCVYRLFYCVKHANRNVIKALMNNVKVHCQMCWHVLHLLQHQISIWVSISFDCCKKIDIKHKTLK